MKQITSYGFGTDTVGSRKTFEFQPYSDNYFTEEKICRRGARSVALG